MCTVFSRTIPFTFPHDLTITCKEKVLHSNKELLGSICPYFNIVIQDAVGIDSALDLTPSPDIFEVLQGFEVYYFSHSSLKCFTLNHEKTIELRINFLESHIDKASLLSAWRGAAQMQMNSVLERLDEEILSCDIDNPPFGFKTVYLLAKQLDRKNVLVELVNRFLDRSLEDSKTKSMIESFTPEDALVFLQDVERFKNRTSAYLPDCGNDARRKMDFSTCHWKGGSESSSASPLCA